MESEIEEKMKEEVEVEPLYTGDLTLESIQENPVLKPILEVNKRFMETQKLLNNFIWLWEKDKETINTYLEEEPIYSQMMLVGKVQSYINNVTHTKFLQDSQQELLKKAMQDMIEISKQQVEELRGLEEENVDLIRQMEEEKTEKKPEEEQEETKE